MRRLLKLPTLTHLTQNENFKNVLERIGIFHFSNELIKIRVWAACIAWLLGNRGWEPVECVAQVADRLPVNSPYALVCKVNILIIFSLSFIGCFQKEDNRDNLTLLGGLLYVNSQRQIGDFNCNTSPSPASFAEFRNLIDTLNTSASKCSECHGANTAQSNFIITNYNSVLERVIPGSPNESILYFKVRPGGAMNVYSNSQVNQAIYCYIANGAKP